MQTLSSPKKKTIVGAQFQPTTKTQNLPMRAPKTFAEDKSYLKQVSQIRRLSVVSPQVLNDTSGQQKAFFKLQQNDSKSLRNVIAPQSTTRSSKKTEPMSEQKKSKTVREKKTATEGVLMRNAKAAANALVYEGSNFMDIMQTSKGRDKIFALIQYSVDLYVKCMDSSSESSNPFTMPQLNIYTQQLIDEGTSTMWSKYPPVLRETLRSGEKIDLKGLCLYYRNEALYNREDLTNTDRYKVANTFVKAIRSGRKVFKLLKFVDELKEFVNLSKNQDFTSIKKAIYELVTEGKFDVNSPAWPDLLLWQNKIASFFYYLLDNMHWVASVGMLSSKIYNKARWKWGKDMISLWKNYIQVFRSILLYRQSMRKLQDCEKELKGIEHQVVGTTCLKATEAVRKWINQRSKMYDYAFVLVRNTLRILMLNYKLKIPVWRTIFHPIFVICLGIFQNITALFKIWLKKKYHKLNGQMIRIQEYINLLPRMEEYGPKQARKNESTVNSSRVSVDQGDAHSSDLQQARQETVHMPHDSLYSGNKAAIKMARQFNLNGSASNSSLNQMLGRCPKPCGKSDTDSESLSSAVCASRTTDFPAIEQHHPVTSQFFEDDYLYDPNVLFKGSKGGYKLQSLRQNDIAIISFPNMFLEDATPKKVLAEHSDSELESFALKHRQPVHNSIILTSQSDSAGSD